MNQQINLPKTRTIILYGFKDEADFSLFTKELTDPKILEHYTIPNSLLLFITFFNIKDSMEFMKNLNSSPTSKNISAKFTISKNEIPAENEECKEKANQASVIIQYKNCQTESDHEIYDLASTCGEIRECRLDKDGQKIYEYFNIKSARKAIEKLNIPIYKGAPLKARFVWDIMPHIRAFILKDTDEILKSEMVKRNVKLGEPNKRIKLSRDLNPTKSKNIFIELFDDFIIENLNTIEKIIK